MIRVSVACAVNLAYSLTLLLFHSFRQVTGPCGAEVPDSELVSWEVFYDGSTEDSPDSPPNEPPNAGNSGRYIYSFLFFCI